jgi:hypothetical protein
MKLGQSSHEIRTERSELGQHQKSLVAFGVATVWPNCGSFVSAIAAVVTMAIANTIKGG